VRPNLSTDLVRRIIELIRNDDLRPGDRLPSVRSLAERFLVTPPTVRQALGRLQTSGVVEIRHGSGVYVRSSRERVVLTNPHHNEIEPRTMLELLDARLLIEPHLAEMAARNANEVEIAELERLLGKAEECLDGNNDEMLNRANMGFHRAIANFSENTILAQVVQSLIELYSFQQLTVTIGTKYVLELPVNEGVERGGTFGETVSEDLRRTRQPTCHSYPLRALTREDKHGLAANSTTLDDSRRLLA
jgi:GntR family transcriptional regulator, transcriptional repressor for pyruvate dehydrogenase complex